jgi:hypothetical protein
MSIVFLDSRSPSCGFGTTSSAVGAYFSPSSPSCVIETGVMCESSDPYSSSYMVIKYMWELGIPIPFDALADIS